MRYHNIAYKNQRTCKPTKARNGMEWSGMEWIGPNQAIQRRGHSQWSGEYRSHWTSLSAKLRFLGALCTHARCIYIHIFTVPCVHVRCMQINFCDVRVVCGASGSGTRVYVLPRGATRRGSWWVKLSG